MSTINDGGPEYPVADHFAVCCPGTKEEAVRLQRGMSLRDYFAAHVQPPAEIARTWGELMVRPYPKSEDGERDAPWGIDVIVWWQDVDAAWRYAQADAMLRARANSTLEGSTSK